MKVPKLFGKVMAFLIVRDDEDFFWVVHCPKNPSDTWIVKRVTQLIKNGIGDMVLFDNNKKPLSDGTAARMIAELALKDDKKFWKVDPTDKLYGAEKLREEIGSEIDHSFMDATYRAVETLRWYKLG